MRYRIPRQSRQSFCIPPRADSLNRVKFTRTGNKVRLVRSSSLSLELSSATSTSNCCCSQYTLPSRLLCDANPNAARSVTDGHGMSRRSLRVWSLYGTFSTRRRRGDLVRLSRFEAQSTADGRVIQPRRHSPLHQSPACPRGRPNFNPGA